MQDIGKFMVVSGLILAAIGEDSSSKSVAWVFANSAAGGKAASS